THRPQPTRHICHARNINARMTQHTPLINRRPHQRLIDALRTGAGTAMPDEAVRAREYADDLASAVDTQDADRTTRILGRINALLSTASAAFTLTRELLPPGS
ncbi:hypothetical protein ACWD6R_32435, partial [Streptomyces sp. NPDC005151]